jgi:hypothetical protein
MNRLTMALGTLAGAFAGAGCAPTVLDPIHQGQQQGSGPGGTQGSGPGGTQMLAMLSKDVPPIPQNPSSFPAPVFFPFTNGDPDALILVFSNAALSCASPAITCGGDEVWETIIALPSDLVRVGPIDLGNPRVSMTNWTFLGDGMGMCGGGGGGGGIGVPADPGKTLQITSTDSGSISVELSGGVQGGVTGMINGMSTPIIDGSYTASRCEPAPATPPPKAAVAILGSKLPAGLPANPTIGTTPDPTALYVFLGTGTQTCADPLSDLGCAGAGRIVLKIPAALQQPGTLQLPDPQLATSVEVAASSGTPNCTASSGSFSQGTLTISSADTTGLTFTLYQSLVASSPPPSFDADGLYQATICP